MKADTSDPKGLKGGLKGGTRLAARFLPSIDWRVLSKLGVDL